MNINDDINFFCDDLLEELSIALENGKIDKDEYDRLVAKAKKHRQKMLNEIPTAPKGKLLFD